VVAGHTQSPDLPTLDPGGPAHHEAALTGWFDAYLMEFDLNGGHVWGTYTGHSVWTEFQGLAVDRDNGDVVLVGRTSSPNVPVTVGAPWYDDSFASGSNGMLLQFSGVDRSIEYATYISGAGPVEPRTVVVSRDGHIHVAGITWDPQFPIQAAGGLYTASSLLGDQHGDGFIMSFTPEHWLTWSTYFGGDESGSVALGDCIRTLAIGITNELHAGGYTAAAFDQGEFFPLHDPGNGAWADQGLYPHMDAFVASFCVSDILTQVTDEIHLPGPIVFPIGEGSYQVQGMDMVGRTYRVFDGLGRIISQGRLDAAGRLDLGRDTPGVYMLQMEDRRVIRIPVVEQ
jgi:hypothetical protein